jgi:hypothetical protein
MFRRSEIFLHTNEDLFRQLKDVLYRINAISDL